jgi:4-amino-4-deoxy-L-arabinose transferase-like glycosyltransferase
MSLALLDRLSCPFAGVVDGLCDSNRRRRVCLAVVCVYGAAWFLYGVIAKSTQDINADMAEMVVWAREPALGYPKHPPLLAYIVKLWFAIFPTADWAFTLLAAVTLGAGIFLAVELCGVWLDGTKRAAVPFLLGAIPFYNFLGLKFDQNSALIPLWALAMWALLRSLESRRAGWAVVAGLAAAAAILTKYWSAFLLAAMALTVLTDHRRNAYWRSAAPWITALVFGVVVLPHLIWLIHENFPPITWVKMRRVAHSSAELTHSLGVYVGGSIGYAFGSLALVATVIHPSSAAVRDSWFVLEPARRPATLLFWTPLVLPIVAALAFRTDLQSIWNGPAFNLLPVMMLASPLVQVTRLATMRIAAIVTAFSVLAIAAAPLVALGLLKNGVENDAAYARLLADATERQWHADTPAPLQLVAGRFIIVSAVSFYGSDKPSIYSDFSDYLSPWVSDARIARQGMAIVCAADDKWCVHKIATYQETNPAARRADIALTRHWLGFAGGTENFVIGTVPPPATPTHAAPESEPEPEPGPAPGPAPGRAP